MPRLFRRVPPVVVAAVGVLDRRLGELLVRRIVERADLECDEVAAQSLDAAGSMSAHTAGRAKVERHRLAAPLVGAGRVAALQPAEGGWLHRDAPVPGLRAD